MVVTPNILRGFLALLIFWVIEQLHLPADLGLKGLNSLNLLVLACVMVLLGQRFPKSEPTPIRWAFLLFFCMLTWGFIVGQMRDGSLMLEDLTALKNGIFFVSLYFIFFHAARDERTIHLMFVMLLAVAMLVALEAIREGIDYGFGVYSESKRSAGPFGQDASASNLLAVYLAIFTPPFVGVALYAKGHPWVRAAAIAGAVLMVIATFCTYSRQAYGIVAVTILLMTMRRNLILGALIAFALVNFESWVPAGVVDRIAMTEQVTETGEKTLDSSTASRFELWEAAAALRAEQPTGIGLNHFKREVGRIDPRYVGMDAHNFFVLISTEAGIFGFLATVLLCLALLWLGWSFMRRADTPESKAMAISFLVSTLALILGNVYGSRMLDGAVTGPYWIFAALVARYRILIETGHRWVPKAARAADDDLAGASIPAPSALVNGRPRPGGRLQPELATARSAQTGRRQSPAPVATSRGRTSHGAPRQRDRNGRLLPPGSPTPGRH